MRCESVNNKSGMCAKKFANENKRVDSKYHFRMFREPLRGGRRQRSKTLRVGLVSMPKCIIE